MEAAGVGADEAGLLIREAEGALEILRRRSELRKFVRKVVPPRKGRSHAKIIRSLLEQGIGDIRALSQAGPATLKKAGIGEAGATELLSAARGLCNERALREAGVPAVSLKKYQAGGVASPDDFCYLPIPYLSSKTGINPETVHKHVDMVCRTSAVPFRKRSPRQRSSAGEKNSWKFPASVRRPWTGSILQASMTLQRFVRRPGAGRLRHRHREGQTPRLHQPPEVTPCTRTGRSGHT
jgi:DNA topoisomerase-1